MVYFYHPDHLGSSSYITDANGEVSQHLEYFAFGETFVEEHSNKDATPYLYNAKELDEETGLYYYGARYYDPVTSIWQSVDPLAEKYPHMSPYAFAANSPVIYIDPNGEDWFVNNLGFYIWSDDTSVPGFSYAGNILPEGIHRYKILVNVDGKLYHKNTSNIFAEVGNFLGGDFVGQKPYSASGERFNDELFSTAVGFGVFKAGGIAFKALNAAGGSIWKLPTIGMGSRGFVYEKMVGIKGLMKSPNFPVIDAFHKGVATSIKTMDLSLKTYAKQSRVYRTLKGYIDKLSKFNGKRWGRDIVQGSDIKKKVLELGIPKGANKTQIEQIQKAVEYAADKGIKMNVRVVK